MCWQKTPEETGKIESILARLNRFRAVVSGADGGSELKPQMVLFE